MVTRALRAAQFSGILSGLPAYHMDQVSVSCPREAKGKVMRLLHEQHTSRRNDTTDGLKVWLGDRQWVLVIPDPDRPLFHIHAEGESDMVAHEIAQRYQRIVESLRG